MPVLDVEVRRLREWDITWEAMVGVTQQSFIAAAFFFPSTDGLLDLALIIFISCVCVCVSAFVT